MSDRFISHAQNGEDVVLWRALGHVREGFYVDVGANHPSQDSVTRSLYDRGWRGVTVEPVAAYVDLHREQRPRDSQVQAVALGRAGKDSTTLDDVLDGVDPGTQVHVVSIGVGGTADEALAGLDLSRHRPWVLVVKARTAQGRADGNPDQAPTRGSWEPAVLAAGYELCLDDGVSRFYVAHELAADLAPALSYPACAFDDFVTARVDELGRRLEVARADAIRWRGLVLRNWAEHLVTGEPGVDAKRARTLEQELVALRGTLSWRVTRPLRWARGRQLSRPSP